MPVGNYEQKGKNSFFFSFSCLYLFISGLSFKPFIMTDDSLSFVCSKAWVGCGIWIKLRRPSATPEHKILLVVCAFIHRVSQGTLANIWVTFLCILRMCVCLCGTVHVLILPHCDILHNGGSSLNMLMASLRYDSVTIWINISSSCNIAISLCRLCGLVTQLKTRDAPILNFSDN